MGQWHTAWQSRAAFALPRGCTAPTQAAATTHVLAAYQQILVDICKVASSSQKTQSASHMKAEVGKGPLCEHGCRLHGLHLSISPLPKAQGPNTSHAAVSSPRCFLLLHFHQPAKSCLAALSADTAHLCPSELGTLGQGWGQGSFQHGRSCVTLVSDCQSCSRPGRATSFLLRTCSWKTLERTKPPS